MYRLTIILLSINNFSYGQMQAIKFQLPKIELPNLKNQIYSKKEIPQVNIHEMGKVQSTSAQCSSSASCVLPLTSLILKGLRLTKNTVKLDWETLNEIDGKSFDLERSFDNAAIFVKAGSVNSNPDAIYKKNYTTIDNNYFEGRTYYRIKQLDINGKFTYSNIISVNGLANEEIIQLYPNPAKNNIYVELVSNKTISGKITILDASSKTVFSQNTNIIKGLNNIPINITALSNGFYIMRITRPLQIDLIIKFVKN